MSGIARISVLLDQIEGAVCDGMSGDLLVDPLEMILTELSYCSESKERNACYSMMSALHYGKRANYSIDVMRPATRYNVNRCRELLQLFDSLQK